jgi:hypothetical protein
MKDLNLTRTIPLVGLGAFVLVGCGGRSIDDGSGSSRSDQLSDENFDDTLFESFEDLCAKQERCGDSSYSDASECAEYYVDGFDVNFDLDSRACRRLAIDAIDCLANQPGCDEVAFAACEEEIYDFGGRCADYGDYDYYDY